MQESFWDLSGPMDPNKRPSTFKTVAGLGSPGSDEVVGPSRARDILSSIGWLAKQPEEFQEEVFKRAVPMKYGTNDVIYRIADPPGGIYGIVGGAVVASVAPRHAASHLLHLLTPGSWVGEASFLSREPRRVGLHAAIDTSAIYLPLDSMDQMAGRDPMATRRFTQIAMTNLDIVLRAFYDLQDPDEHRRIARALRRIAAMENTPIPLAQSALGMLANASRKTVNAALRQFVEGRLGEDGLPLGHDHGPQGAQPLRGRRWRLAERLRVHEEDVVPLPAAGLVERLPDLVGVGRAELEPRSAGLPAMRFGGLHQGAAGARAARGGRDEEVVEDEGSRGEHGAECGVELGEADQFGRLRPRRR